jgi:hypothetical protein
MEPNNDADVDVQDVPELPQVADGQQDTTDWKATALKMQGMAKRFKTKIDKMTTAPKTETTTTQNKTDANQTKGFDYAQKAYLKASGFAQDEFALVEEAMKGTGLDIDGVLGSKWFQAALKEQRELKATGEATPNGTKRAGNQTRNDVDYWIAKGELPPLDQPELRRKVVNAKIKAAKEGSMFTNTPVVS